jgi:hypothetical protein
MWDFFLYLSLIFSGVIGIACLFWPKMMQKIGIKMSEWTAPNDIFRDWMRTDSYLLVIQGIGVVTILSVILVIYVLSIK